MRSRLGFVFHLSMHSGLALLTSALLGASVLWPAAAQAQVRYSCRDEGGRTYTLSRPCPQGFATTAVSAGPLSEPSRRYEPAPRPVADAPEHHRYMSGRCRALDDAMRTAYQNGTPADVVAGMRREYQRDCRDEESEASVRLSRERREAQRQRRDGEREAQVAQQAAQEVDARRMQQCTESRRILAAKKARTDLTPGEINDLRRFEDNIAARCQH